jgi:large-conductance mechanosensitive channel
MCLCSSNLTSLLCLGQLTPNFEVIFLCFDRFAINNVMLRFQVFLCLAINNVMLRFQVFLCLISFEHNQNRRRKIGTDTQASRPKAFTIDIRRLVRKESSILTLATS